MKKVFMLLVAAGALAFASCGGDEKEEEGKEGTEEVKGGDQGTEEGKKEEVNQPQGETAQPQAGGSKGDK